MEGWGAIGIFMDRGYTQLSPEWAVESVLPLPARSELPAGVESFPSKDEPSDHLLIGATLRL
jgi:hypothetical protein